jgi:hypothetical protein
MKTALVYHNLGLGDAIICNGIINNIAKNFDTVFIFCKPKFYESIKFLYNDNPKVVPLPADDSEALAIYSKLTTNFKAMYTSLVIIPISKAFNLNFDQAFYKAANLDFEKRFTDFKLNRDKKRELDLFNKLNLKPGKYIFLHDDKTRNFNINRNHIQDKSLPVVFPDHNLTNNIFDFCHIIENAAELHVIDSSFKNLCENLDIKTKKLFYHCNYIPRNVTISKKNWVKL